MSIFDRLLTQPIFNLLALIYNFIGDFGVAIIILTIIVRIILWPLVKKQLHQTKLMRSIQPELKRIKKQANGNRMIESTMMMALYKEKGVKPFSSMLVLLIQLPIFIALVSVIQLFNMTLPAETDANYEQFVKIKEERKAKLDTLAYPGISDLNNVKSMTSDPENFKPKLFGAIDLTQSAGNYFPALIIAILAAAFQFIQSKQLIPKSTDKRKLRDMFKDAAKGKEVDQADMMSATSGKMMYMMSFMTFLIALALPAAVVLYYAITSLVAVIQQRFVLKKDSDELLEISGETKKNDRTKNAIEAEIIEVPAKEIKKAKTSAKTKSEPTSSGGQTVVRRIKAKK
ncbi:MAG: YidC/Oxa1 family membrane protein insertase [Candidatus Nomurabacteria bacterium]|jgi:YidC/Oxa1 family membrane protein insertase|nr:YidC/Oxa1 family membrane protein insertase [Candidatus Nomurabacteria bacterium]